MYIKKNQVAVLIEDCCHCPNATLKFDRAAKEDVMYCQTANSLIMLRDNGWGPRPIPDWCPRLNHTDSTLRQYCGERAEIPGIIS